MLLVTAAVPLTISCFIRSRRGWRRGGPPGSRRSLSSPNRTLNRSVTTLQSYTSRTLTEPNLVRLNAVARLLNLDWVAPRAGGRRSPHSPLLLRRASRRSLFAK